MTNDKDDRIEILPDGVPIPDNLETFGKLISEALKEKEAEIEITAKQKKHNKLYSRWCSMARRSASPRFAFDDRVFTDIRIWEIYMCRFEESAEQWFVQLSSEQRIDLCELSRATRRNR